MNARDDSAEHKAHEKARLIYAEGADTDLTLTDKERAIIDKSRPVFEPNPKGAGFMDWLDDTI